MLHTASYLQQLRTDVMDNTNNNKTKEPDNKGLQYDIEIVIKNYGRSKGRNEK